MIERAVYSLWTSPMDGEHVGFNTEEALINCFKLSLHYTKKWFKEVHLVTDVKGKALVEKHALEFDNINTDLEYVMRGVYRNHWSLGKIYACKIQDKPFMHIDIDVIWFKEPPKKLFFKDAIFQNSEKKSWPHYREMMAVDKKNYTNKPKWYDVDNIQAYNLGIIGFNKLSFLKEWWNESLKYIKHFDSEKEHLKSVHNVSCLIFEQHFVGCLCKHYNYSVSTLTDLDSNKSKDEWPSEQLAKSLGYTHLVSGSKRDKKIENLVKRKLEKIVNESLIPA
jgi:hypothetical protein